VKEWARASSNTTPCLSCDAQVRIDVRKKETIGTESGSSHIQGIKVRQLPSVLRLGAWGKEPPWLAGFAEKLLV